MKLNLTLPDDLVADLRAAFGERGISEGVIPTLRTLVEVRALSDHMDPEDAAVAAVSRDLGLVTRSKGTPHGWQQRGGRWVARAGSHDLPALMAEAERMGLVVEGPPSVPLTGWPS